MPTPEEIAAGNQPAPEPTPTPQADKSDAFGVEENQIAATAEAAKPEVEKPKEFAPIPEDHPTIVGLKSQIDDIKREYGGNLSGQRTVIDGLEKKIADLTAGKGSDTTTGDGGDADVLFKDIKFSKDLTKEEREEMTDREIAQMDQIAEMQTAQNKLYADQKKSMQTVETAKVADINASVQSLAKEMSKDASGKENTDLANQIIESAKMFNLEGLTPDQLKERVASAAKLVPSYKAPKEQKTVNSTTVTPPDTVADPFGVDKIIEEAQSKKGGNYNL